MSDEKILAGEKLSDEDLKEVAGGTVQQCREIFSAVNSNPKLKLMFNKLNGTPSPVHIPHLAGGKSGADQNLERVLGFIGVDASLERTNGTMDDIQNQYKDSVNGQELTHSQVLDRIKNF